jgi:hypothetical protein
MYGRNEENILVGNSECRRTLGKTRSRKKPNNKTNPKE